MTREDFLRLADEAGIGFWGDTLIVLNPDTFGEDALKRFAELVVENYKDELDRELEEGIKQMQARGLGQVRRNDE